MADSSSTGNNILDTLKRYSFMFSVVSSLVGLGGGVIGGTWRAEARIKEVSEDVVRQQWLQTLQAETQRIATDAAVTAAERAVNQAIVPVVREQTKHDAADDQRQQETDRRLDRIERKLGFGTK